MKKNRESLWDWMGYWYWRPGKAFMICPNAIASGVSGGCAATTVLILALVEYGLWTHLCLILGLCLFAVASAVFVLATPDGDHLVRAPRGALTRGASIITSSGRRIAARVKPANARYGDWDDITFHQENQ